MTEPGASVYERTAPYFAKTRAAAYRTAADEAQTMRPYQPSTKPLDLYDAGFDAACKVLADRLEQMAREAEGVRQ